MTIKKSYPYLVLFILAFSCSLLIKNLLKTNNSKPSSASLTSYNSKEIVLIYLADSTCPYCRSDDVITKIRATDIELSKIAKRINVGYKKIGISIDKNPKVGFSYFGNIIDFNEFIIGSGWANTGVLRYIYTDFQSHAATPQLIITIREYNRIRIPPSTETYRGLKDEKILLNLIGAEILGNIEFDKFFNL